MNIDDFMGGSTLSKEDVPTPRTFRITDVKIREFDGGKRKPTLVFAEMSPQGSPWEMVMNPTNLQLAAQVLGSKVIEHWIGQQLTIYADPNVSMGGRLVGGLRVQVATLTPQQQAPAPQYQAPQQQAPAPQYQAPQQQAPIPPHVQQPPAYHPAAQGTGAVAPAAGPATDDLDKDIPF